MSVLVPRMATTTGASDVQDPQRSRRPRRVICGCPGSARRSRRHHHHKGRLRRRRHLRHLLTSRGRIPRQVLAGQSGRDRPERARRRQPEADQADALRRTGRRHRDRLDSSGMAAAPVLDPENADFDGSKIVWLGSLSSEPAFCITTKASARYDGKVPRRAFPDRRVRQNSTTYTQAAIPKNALGAKFDIVTGFDGVPEIVLAMERGELAGCARHRARRHPSGPGSFNVIGRIGTAAAAELPTPRFAT